MRTLRSLALALCPLVIAAACGDDGHDHDHDVDAADVDAPDIDAPAIDGPPPIDAMPADLDCVGDPEPTTAPESITVTGRTNAPTAQGSNPVADVVIEAFTVADGTTPIATATSDAQGEFTLTIDTGEEPVDGYVRATDAGYLVTYVWPPAPLTADVASMPVLLLSESTLGLFPLLGAPEQDPAKGMMGLVVMDCAGDPIEGATVTVTGNGTVVYTNDGLPAAGATATDASGVVLIFNIDPGEVTVDGTAMGMSLRDRVVTVLANTVTTTVIAPGPIDTAR